MTCEILTRYNSKGLEVTVPDTIVGIAWDLREMGSAQGKGVREGQAPQTKREISSQLPAKKEATWRRRKRKDESGVMKRNQRAQSEHPQEGFLTM
jgi:hypothetical protein